MEQQTQHKDQSVSWNTTRWVFVPFLIQFVLRGLIRLLSDCGGGIKINNDSYNVFCYADDLILTSLSVIGLQKLIDKARKYITNHGINFNPSKTWNLDGKPLGEQKTVTYLGTSLSENTNDHVNARVQSGRRAFYGLQSVGLCTNGVTPDATALNIKVECKCNVCKIIIYAALTLCLIKNIIRIHIRIHPNIRN